ncbi:chemotaxis protein CheD [Natronolimnobius baerhuensis]|uniref:Probable chemoreceptor glutamine deamidase CheD n=1 Tax=Natronolimnobius baerhuensis TaxID=253108 RepID=A0A202E6E7_9EURY|nr:chemotaxis protein CheD [Natronolimnobius baerhuensis]OVE83764.1 chemotaxis protein CheD [Natronolimnobius baerhuensis]
MSESDPNSERAPIPVGIAEYAVSTDERPLRTSGVGSCGVVAVYDEAAGVSGLLHFMLPSAQGAGESRPAAKFADTGIPKLLSAVEAHGGQPTRAWAKLSGGATMVPFESLEESVGEQNVAAARAMLAAENIRIRGTDVGGERGRQVTFMPRTGELVVTTADGETRRW